MARHEHLPIFKKAYELTLLLEELVRNFSRYHKYGLGQELRDGARGILLCIVRTNNQSDKMAGLDELRGRLAELQILARLAKDTQALPGFKAYERLSGLIVDVSRQMEGWRRQQAKIEANGQNSGA